MIDSQSFVELALFPGREALAYFNGIPAQGLSENHKSIRLSKPEHLKTSVDLVIEAYTEAVRFPPAERYYGKFEYAQIQQIDRAVYDLSWDLRVALDTARELDPESASFQRLLDLMIETLRVVNPMPSSLEDLRRVVSKASKIFRLGLKDPTLGIEPWQSAVGRPFSHRHGLALAAGGNAPEVWQDLFHSAQLDEREP